MEVIQEKSLRLPLCRRLTSFTLAEILITLGIIGVIAAMTIPTLMKNTQDNELKVAWKKAYSDISNAYTRFLQDNGGTAIGAFPRDYEATTYLTPYLKVAKKYLNEKVITGQYMCGGDPVTFGNGNTGGNGIALSNGVIITSPNHGMADCKSAYHNYCSELIIDVNGNKQPNIIGKDIFELFLMENRVVPAGPTDPIGGDGLCIQRGEPNWDKCLGSPYGTINYGWGCSAQYLYK